MGFIKINNGPLTHFSIYFKWSINERDKNTAQGFATFSKKVNIEI